MKKMKPVWIGPSIIYLTKFPVTPTYYVYTMYTFGIISAPLNINIEAFRLLSLRFIPGSNNEIELNKCFNFKCTEIQIKTNK